jgi:hypothetical protein
MTAGSIHLRSPRFLPGVGAYFVLGGLVKGCLCEPREMYGPGPYMNQACKACGMLIGFSRAGCTSIQITATLGYEYRLFVAVITWIT